MAAKQTPAPPRSEEKASATAKKPPRSLLIDVVRGIAITLVVMEHTSQGIIRRGWYSPRVLPTMQHLDIFVYAFHMPAFFVVAGVFLVSSVERYGLTAFAANRARALLYPHVVWATLFLYSPLLFQRWMLNTAPAWPDFVNGVLTGRLGWFFPSLFFATMIAAWLRHRPLLLLLVVSAVVSFFWVPCDIMFVDDGLKFLPLVFAGMWLGRHYGRISKLNRWLAAALALAAGFALWNVTGRFASEPPRLFLIAGIWGTVMLLLIARAAGESPVARGVGWLGRASLGIFVLSPWVQGGVRAVMVRAHLNESFLQLVVVSAIATLIPAVVYYARQKLRIGWLFEPPARRQTADTARGL